MPHEPTPPPSSALDRGARRLVARPRTDAHDVAVGAAPPGVGRPVRAVAQDQAEADVVIAVQVLAHHAVVVGPVVPAAHLFPIHQSGKLRTSFRQLVGCSRHLPVVFLPVGKSMGSGGSTSVASASTTVARSLIHSSSVIGLSLITYLPSTCSSCCASRQSAGLRFFRDRCRHQARQQRTVCDVLT